MKKLPIFAAILAMSSLFMAGCGQTTSGSPEHTDNLVEQQNLMEQQISDEETPECPDGGCKDRMPHRKPDFKFRVPPITRERNGGHKFRFPHKKPSPEPELPETPEAPETPETPEVPDGGNN